MIGYFVAVFDTNVLVSAMMSKRGNEARAINLWHARRFQIATSDKILEEYRAVLTRAKFGFEPSEVAEFLAPFLRNQPRFQPDFTLAVSPHEPDNRLLECAEASNAEYLITGNLKHFPTTYYGRTRILNAKSFLELLEPNHP